MSTPRPRRRRTRPGQFAPDTGPERARVRGYLVLLVGILAVFMLMVASGGTPLGAGLRVLLLSVALLLGLRIARQFRRFLTALLILAILAVGATVAAGAVGEPRLVSAVSAAATVTLVAVGILVIGQDLRHGLPVTLATVFGVLCVYLLLALLFSGVHQFGAAIESHYLNGAGDDPEPSDFLYFSVITMATVGFGDITPASGLARAVTILEALVGQLYLVSVVATVVGSWRAPNASDGDPPRTDSG